jgi:hypothetical protein
LADVGDMIRISAPATPHSFWTDLQVPTSNQGLFRIVAVAGRRLNPNSGGTIWIEADGIEEGVFDSVLGAVTYKSLVPGDVVHINTDVWGVENRGSWVVEKVGVASAASNDQYVSPNKFKVSIAERTPTPISGVSGLSATNNLLIRYVEGTPNQDDGTFMDVRWSPSAGYEFVSSSAGSIITPLDKVDFSTDLASGADGYKYNTGLIGEANRVVYGEPSDTATYPGIAAAGAQILISGPLVKRVRVALGLRIRSGASNQDVADRVRSAVATVVNQTKLGQPVSLSKIVGAAEKIVGVIAVVMISPAYGVGNDLIPVQSFEKPMILDLEQDVQISFTGE